MTYKYDVFVSYARDPWHRWVKTAFVPLLEAVLKDELASECNGGSVFFDESDIRTGSDWPRELAKALSRSRIILALWSPSYFQSSWCCVELGMMEHRYDQHGNDDVRLIVGAAVHDGDRFPARIQRFQRADLTSVARIYMARGSPKWERLEDILRERFARDIADAVRSAPAYDPAWEDVALAAVSEISTERYKLGDAPGRVPRFGASPPRRTQP